MTCRSGLALLVPVLVVLTLACRNDPEPTRTSAAELAPAKPAPEPEHHLIRYACQGFDAAVAEGAAENRLLSTSAKHAIALGGERVETATQRWALLPPQGLLELIDRYEREAKPDPKLCAGLRAHLDRMSQTAAAH